MSDVDKLFEEFFGYDTSPRKPKTATKPAVDPELLAVADSADSVHEDPSDAKAPGSIEDAARAVRDAVLAHTGRRRPAKAWRPVAARALGLRRLVEKRWQVVLDKGVELELFTIDTKSLSYPVLVGIPDPEPEPVDEEWEALVAKQEADEARRAEELRSRPSPPSHPPEDWNPARYLDCGHWDYQSYPRPLEEGEDPKKRKGPLNIHIRVESPEDCLQCKAGRIGHPQHQKGEYRTPVPEKMRRTVAREAGLGFPGYCADQETGMYIGGLVNHCRFTNPKGPHCAAHASPMGSKKH